MSQSIASLFQRLTQGVYVIGVADGETTNAFTAAWVMQVSFDPLLLALSINSNHASYAVLSRGRVFSVNVLGKDQLAVAAHFGQPAGARKLATTAWTTGQTGAPLLADAVAWFDCTVTDQHPAGDHVLVVGRVVDGRLLDPDATPLSYRDTGALDGAAALFPATFGNGSR
ncbi:flavin reductase family protein [Hyphomicrobium sp. CS1GBMeth3]|uniref:flavin reductase family protein n=1 Tax=Hyphomicrobium sp. CS1GBMeth3 TaxID=1892845 RepID=UPI000931589B|nr:flavin reductase family protein [Hyphomicrobium sp. CS1GBMeth3]